MEKQGAFSGSWQDSSNTITVNLPLISFKEDNADIIYCPALDISGYGYSEKEASDSFTIALAEFFRYSINKHTFQSE